MTEDGGQKTKKKMDSSFVVSSKATTENGKQSQLSRAEFCVLRTAKKKMQNKPNLC